MFSLQNAAEGKKMNPTCERNNISELFFKKPLLCSNNYYFCSPIADVA